MFYRYNWLAPLNSKHTTKIAIELKEIYDVHGTLENLQSDRGKEFYGAVKTYCEKKKVKMTPKVGLTSRNLKAKLKDPTRKINCDLVKQGRKGVNWVELAGVFKMPK